MAVTYIRAPEPEREPGKGWGWDHTRPSPPPDWQARRRAVYERDKGQCFFCGEHVPWQVYHCHHVGNDPADFTLPNLAVAHKSCNERDGIERGVAARRAKYGPRPTGKHPGLK